MRISRLCIVENHLVATNIEAVRHIVSDHSVGIVIWSVSLAVGVMLLYWNVRTAIEIQGPVVGYIRCRSSIEGVVYIQRRLLDACTGRNCKIIGSPIRNVCGPLIIVSTLILTVSCWIGQVNSSVMELPCLDVIAVSESLAFVTIVVNHLWFVQWIVAFVYLCNVPLGVHGYIYVIKLRCLRWRPWVVTPYFFGCSTDDSVINQHIAGKGFGSCNIKPNVERIGYCCSISL